MALSNQHSTHVFKCGGQFNTILAPALANAQGIGTTVLTVLISYGIELGGLRRLHLDLAHFELQLLQHLQQLVGGMVLLLVLGIGAVATVLQPDVQRVGQLRRAGQDRTPQRQQLHQHGGARLLQVLEQTDEVQVDHVRELGEGMAGWRELGIFQFTSSMS